MSEMEGLYEELNEYQKDILQQAFADGEFQSMQDLQDWLEEATTPDPITDAEPDVEEAVTLAQASVKTESSSAPYGYAALALGVAAAAAYFYKNKQQKAAIP